MYIRIGFSVVSKSIYIVYILGKKLFIWGWSTINPGLKKEQNGRVCDVLIQAGGKVVTLENPYGWKNK